MATSERNEIIDLIDRTFTEKYGGSASGAEVFRAVATGLPGHLRDHLIGKGLKAEISSYFRTKRADGLPQAPEVNAERLHKQLDMLDVPEFRYVIGQYLKSSEASHSQATKLAQMCEALHGVAIVLAEPSEATA